MYRSNDAFMLVFICNVMISLWNRLNHYMSIISTLRFYHKERCQHICCLLLEKYYFIIPKLIKTKIVQIITRIDTGFSLIWATQGLD